MQAKTRQLLKETKTEREREMMMVRCYLSQVDEDLHTSLQITVTLLHMDRYLSTTQLLFHKSVPGDIY